MVGADIFIRQYIPLIKTGESVHLGESRAGSSEMTGNQQNGISCI